MPRQARHRHRSSAFPEGTVTSGWGEMGNNSSGFLVDETCDDSTGRPLTSSYFSVTREERTGLSPVNGEFIHAIQGKVTASGYIPYLGRNDDIAGESLVEVTGGAADLIARTNPSRPVVSPLTLAQDVIGIPRLLKDVGKLIRTPTRLLSPREAANQFLGAKFGWLPLIDDAKKLMNLQSYAQQRLGELDRLYSSGGLKRTLTLDTKVGSRDSVVILDSGVPGFSSICRKSTICVAKRWGSVRWKPTSAPPYNSSDTSRIQKANQLVAGLTPEGLSQGAWDLIPWTWITDWFYDVGTLMLQSSNSIPAVPTDVCIMTQYTSNTEWGPAPTAFGPWSGSATRIVKTRGVGSGGVTAGLPFLDTNRLSVLGALFVQRFKR